MSIFSRLFGGKDTTTSNNGQFSPEERELMQRLQQAIPGSSVPSQRRKLTTPGAGSGLTKEIDTRTMAQKAQIAKQEQAAEWAERQRLLAAGHKTHEAANILAREKEVARHSTNKAYRHFHPPGSE